MPLFLTAEGTGTLRKIAEILAEKQALRLYVVIPLSYEPYSVQYTLTINVDIFAIYARTFLVNFIPL